MYVRRDRSSLQDVAAGGEGAQYLPVCERYCGLLSRM